MFDAYRYMGMMPDEFLRLTPREFTIIAEAENERKNDEMELASLKTMWQRQAYHAKRLKASDLFDRNKMKRKSYDDIEDKAEKSKQDMEWLNRFRFSD